MKKRFVGLTLVAVFLMAFAGAAIASHLANHTLFHTTTGAKFDGQWEWFSSSENHGGWHFWGNLVDTICDDDDNVYSKTRAEGYSYSSLYGNEACDTSVTGDTEYQNYEIYAPDQNYTTSANYFACRDRNVYADNCSSDEDNTYTR
ncbi:MAG TPA: hypothetical protein VEV43_13750 [Actinomycetota bacterium]|nr:hypothetical protein [Actinomycetota bacterium]